MQSPSLNYDEETPLTQRIHQLTQPNNQNNQPRAHMQPNQPYEDTVRRAAADVIKYVNTIIDDIFSSNADGALYQSIHPETGRTSTQQPHIQTTGVIQTNNDLNSQAVYDTISSILNDADSTWSTSTARTTQNQWFRRRNGVASEEQRIILNETINPNDYQYEPWSRTR